MRARAPIVFLNGRYVPAARARVSALDRGLLYGDGIFETMRANDGRPHAVGAHLKRLRRTARILGLPFPGSAATWQRRIVECLRRNRLDRGPAAVRLTVTRGAGPEGLLPARRVRPTLLLTARPLDPALPRLRNRGVAVILLPFHPGLRGFLAGHKTLDYLTAMIGKRMARRRGAFEGIYTGAGGEIYEGTTSNLFLVRDGELFTPALARGVLPGITREEVIVLARRAGVRVREVALERKDLESAAEAFLTASTLRIVPVHRVGRRRVGRGVGPVTRRLQILLDADTGRR